MLVKDHWYSSRGRNFRLNCEDEAMSVLQKKSRVPQAGNGPSGAAVAGTTRVATRGVPSKVRGPRGLFALRPSSPGAHVLWRPLSRLAAALCGVLLVWPLCAWAKRPPDAEVDRAIREANNQAIVSEFLKYELAQVDREVTRPLLQSHPSLIFFLKQNERGVLKSLFFLEEQVHKLQDVQRNIDRLPYSIAFSSEEKKKILGLRASADKIVSYGIPLIKWDFYRVVLAAKELADEQRKHPIELLPKVEFRNAVYRKCDADPKSLDRDMGELSEGELICMRLGWVLEQVTVTKLWLVINDNSLPRPEDYMAYRKKRSEYWKKRLAAIYAGNVPAKAK